VHQDVLKQKLPLPISIRLPVFAIKV